MGVKSLPGPQPSQSKTHRLAGITSERPSWISFSGLRVLSFIPRLVGTVMKNESKKRVGHEHWLGHTGSHLFWSLYSKRHPMDCYWRIPLLNPSIRMSRYLQPYTMCQDSGPNWKPSGWLAQSHSLLKSLKIISIFQLVLGSGFPSKLNVLSLNE